MGHRRRSVRSLIHLTVVLIGLILVAPQAGAQSARLLQEIAPGLSPGHGGDVDEMVDLGDETVFVWQGEPWITDGTPEGTRWIKDINPGLGSWSLPREFVELDGKLLFSAKDDDDYGIQLWRTDGTDAGTMMVVDLCPRCGGTQIQHLTRMGDLVYFTALTDAFGVELWVTDGTAAGTSMVADIWPGSLSSSPFYLVELENRLLFTADDPEHGIEPRVTDGTAAGTGILADIAPGEEWSRPHILTVAGGKVYFPAENGFVGDELWMSDGTPAGTRIVADIVPGPLGSSPSNLAAFGDDLVFQAYGSVVGRELWRSDGTAAGTSLIADINPAGDSDPGPIFEFDGGVVFRADDGVHGAELWRSDGSAGGTGLLLDINPGGGDSLPWGFVEYEDHLWFTARPDGDFDQLWRTDGTTAGTEQMSEFQYLGTYGLMDLGPVTSTGLFLTTLGSWSATGELWRIDPAAPTGFRQIATSDRPSPLLVDRPVMVGGRVYLAADDHEHGYELYVHEPGHGVRMLGDLNPGEEDGVRLYYDSIVELNGWAYFRGTTPEHGDELWRTDGTSAGTELFLDIRPGPDGSMPLDLTTMGNHLYFVARDEDYDRGLWRTDGTVAGTEPVVVIGYGGYGSDAFVVGVLDDLIFLTARESTNVPYKLWATDGTAAGTYLVDEVVASFARTALGRLFFAGRRSADGPEPWVSDGSAAGTFKLADIAPGGDGSHPRGFFEIAGGVVFFTSDWQAWELWTTDGTPKGTVEVFHQPYTPGDAAGYQSLDSENMAVLDGVVFFSTRDEDHGAELWRTDGTAEGTRMLKDIRPGGRGSNPESLTLSNGRVWFAANDGVNGVELWVTDGTAEGTRLAVDIAPGSFSSQPQEMVDRGGSLLLLADNITHGFELWLAGDWLFTDGFETGDLAAWN